MYRYFISCLLILIFFGPSLSLAEREGPVFIYRANKERIHAEKLCHIGGYVFSYGVAIPRTQSRTSKGAAAEKAELRAASRITEIVFQKVDWPAHLTIRQKEIFIQQFQKIVSLQIKTSGYLRVDSGNLGPEYFAVVAVPENSIELPLIDFGKIKQTLDLAFNKRAASLGIADYLEICSSEKLDQVISAFAEQLATRYGESVGKVLKGDHVSEPGLLWKRGKRLPFEKISRLSRDDLLRLLGLAPYDPAVLYALGRVFEESGCPKTSQLFFLRGTIWGLDEEFNEKCRKKIHDAYFVTKIRMIEPRLSMLRKRVRVRYGVVGPFEGKLAHLIVQSMGTMPLRYIGAEVAGVTQLQAALRGESPNLKQLQKRIEHFLDEEPSVTMLNLMAEVLEKRGEPLLALPFHRQAGSQLVDLNL